MSRASASAAVLLVLVTVATPAVVAVGDAPAASADPSADAPQGSGPALTSERPADRPPGPNASDDDAGPSANGSGPRIVAAYPNPVADGDPGEYVAVHFPAATNVSGWTLADGDRSVGLPNRTVEGTVAFAVDAAASEHAEHPVVRVEGGLRLANDGDRVELRNGGEVVDAVAYDRAPEAERYVRTDGGWTWLPLGATDFDPVVAGNATATAFVLPDAPGVIGRELRSADRRILLAGYTLTSRRVVDALVAAHRRGVEVAVLLEGSPVGGVSRRQVRALDRLTAAGVPVTVLGGDHARYRNHHAKYAVVDDRALVLTENWKPAGTGGRSSRGWGVVIEDPTVADGLAAVFEADRAGRDGIPWERYREHVDPVETEAAAGDYRQRFAPASVPVERVELLVTPDNARDELPVIVRSAEESVLIQQVSVDPEGPLLAATLAAARDGARVEILLSSAWYVEAENRALARELRALAEAEGLDLSVALVDPRSRFGKVHAKGAVVDDRVVLGSLNWNPTALDENREVVVVLHGEAVADYYRRAFRADRRGGRWRLPAAVGGAVAVAWVAVGTATARRIEWAGADRGWG